MSFDAFYLALLILALFAFMGSLAWAIHDGDAKPGTRKSARPHHGRRPGGPT